MRLEVPDDWPDAKVVNVALRLYDVIHCIGHRVEFEKWKAQFRQASTHESALRQWDRWKAELRQIKGCEFSLIYEGEGLAHTLLFESEAYAMEVVDSLIGPPVGTRDRTQSVDSVTLSVDDIFPDCGADEVREFLESLAEDLVTEDDNAQDQ